MWQIYMTASQLKPADFANLNKLLGARQQSKPGHKVDTCGTEGGQRHKKGSDTMWQQNMSWPCPLCCHQPCTMDRSHAKVQPHDTGHEEAPTAREQASCGIANGAQQLSQNDVK